MKKKKALKKKLLKKIKADPNERKVIFVRATVSNYEFAKKYIRNNDIRSMSEYVNGLIKEARLA